MFLSEMRGSQEKPEGSWKKREGVIHHGDDVFCRRARERLVSDENEFYVGKGTESPDHFRCVSCDTSLVKEGTGIHTETKGFVILHERDLPERRWLSSPFLPR
jgi:hypothetical protein